MYTQRYTPQSTQIHSQMLTQKLILTPKINHQLNDYSKFMKKGLVDPKIWGYGFHRLNVTNTEIDRCPYSFTCFAYKKQSGDLFLGMRINVDTSLLKFVEWDGRNDIIELLSKLMNSLLNEFISNRT